jgi:hypothetical protein
MLDLYIAGFGLCVFIVNACYWWTVSQVKREDPQFRWWKESAWKVYCLHKQYFPNSRIIWLHWISLFGAVGFFLAGCYLQSANGH